MFCVATVQGGRFSKISDVMRENKFDAVGDANDIWAKVGGNLDPESPVHGARVVIAEYKGSEAIEADFIRCYPLRRLRNDRFDCLYACVDDDIAIAYKVRAVNAS